MLDPVQVLQHPIVILSAAASLVLVAIALGLARRSAAPDGGLEAEAWCWIEDQIDRHIGILVASSGGGTGAPPPDLGKAIESFIGMVVLQDQHGDEPDPDLRRAVREFVVLHRAALYDEVLRKVQARTVAG